ncbi:hypothetical protein TKK_0017106 [Trichogramma kaykai]
MPDCFIHQQQQNGYRVCCKAFYCEDCRNTHERSKHPVAKCNLCFARPVLFTPLAASAEKEELKPTKSEELCRIVFSHPPLHCKLYGQRYSFFTVLTIPFSWEVDRKQQHHQQVKTTLPVPLQQHYSSSLDVISCEKLLLCSASYTTPLFS